MDNNLRFFENDREAATIFAATLFYTTEAFKHELPVELVGELMLLSANIAANYLEDVGYDPSSDMLDEFIHLLSVRADRMAAECEA